MFAAQNRDSLHAALAGDCPKFAQQIGTVPLPTRSIPDDASHSRRLADRLSTLPAKTARLVLRAVVLSPAGGFASDKVPAEGPGQTRPIDDSPKSATAAHTAGRGRPRRPVKYEPQFQQPCRACIQIASGSFLSSAGDDGASNVLGPKFREGLASGLKRNSVACLSCGMRR